MSHGINLMQRLMAIHAELTEAIDDCRDVPTEILKDLSRIEGDLEQTISDLAAEDEE